MPKRSHLSDAARLLGQIKTPKKAAAARENGKLGGRPKGSKKSLDEKPNAGLSSPRRRAANS